MSTPIPLNRNAVRNAADHKQALVWKLILLSVGCSNFQTSANVLKCL